MIYSLTYRFDSNSAALAAKIARISGELQALPRRRVSYRADMVHRRDKAATAGVEVR
jgi:hypothetical protein